MILHFRKLTWSKDDPETTRFGSVEQWLKCTIAIEINNTRRWINLRHVRIHADGIKSSCLDLLEDIRPKRRYGEAVCVEFAGAVVFESQEDQTNTRTLLTI